MTIKLEGTIKRYVGNAYDVKPSPGVHPYATMTANELPPGSSFLEEDTGRIYRWNGAEWTCGTLGDVHAGLLEQIILELRALRERIELVSELVS